MQQPFKGLLSCRFSARCIDRFMRFGRGRVYSSLSISLNSSVAILIFRFIRGIRSIRGVE